MLYVLFILGLILLAFGGDTMVNGSVGVAKKLKVSTLLIGIVLVGFGTSTPELVASFIAINQEVPSTGIAIGNIIGSNIFNMLLIIGVSAAIKPIIYNISYNKDLIILLTGTLVLALFPLIPPKNKMSRMNGIVYVLMYAGYMASLFFV